MDIVNATLVGERYDPQHAVWVVAHDVFRHRVVDPLWVYDSPFKVDARPSEELLFLLTNGSAGLPVPGTPRLSMVAGLPENVSDGVRQYAAALHSSHAWWISGEELTSYPWSKAVVQEVDVDPSSFAYRVADVPVPAKKSAPKTLTHKERLTPSSLWGVAWMNTLERLSSDVRYVLLCNT